MEILRRPIDRYVALVLAAGVVLVTLAVMDGAVDRIIHGSPTLWMFALFLMFGELLPVTVPRLGEDEEITTSGTFAYAMVIIAGIAPAALLHAVATFVADMLRRKPWWKAGFNAAQYGLAVVASGAVVTAFTGIPRAATPSFHPAEVPWLIAGAGVFFIINHALTRIAIALAQGGSVRTSIRSDFGFQASTTMVMLALCPIVVVAAERSLWLVPLLSIPMLGVYRSVSIWLDREYREHQALHDPLTSLPNRRLFQDRINQSILTGDRGQAPLAVMLIDLDRFKEVNDTLGHHIGDMLLQQIGPRLQALVRKGDTVARLGGDEFAVLLPGVSDAAGAVSVADKLLRALEEPFVIDELSLDIEASIGIAICPEHGDGVNALMQKADIAMYMAKEAHTGFEMYAPERDQHSPQRLALLGELRRAIETRQFILHYQPVADMRTGRIRGVEALVRWQHPENGLMMPDEFIPLAEHTGMIRSLTMAVLSQSLQQLNIWHGLGLDLGVSVNLSVRNLQDNDFPEEVERLLATHDIDPRYLELEITESAIVVDPIRAMGVLSRLSTMGVGLSLDDFGTGYSSLAYLKRLPVSEIKIDKSFVINMAVDEDDAVIVQSTIDLARNLGLTVVAEGVENEESWRRLAAFGCDLAQGYYLSRPVAAEQLTPWLAEGDRVGPAVLPEVMAQPSRLA